MKIYLHSVSEFFFFIYSFRVSYFISRISNSISLVVLVLKWYCFSFNIIIIIIFYIIIFNFIIVDIFINLSHIICRDLFFFSKIVELSASRCYRWNYYFSNSFVIVAFICILFENYTLAHISEIVSLKCVINFLKILRSKFYALQWALQV